MTEQAQAAEEDLFLGKIVPPSGQTVGSGRSVLWTLPLVATQYQPSHPTPAMQAALQAQNEGRFLDALILLDDAGKGATGSADITAEINLLRSSFLLQGNQSRQALAILSPLFANPSHAADAYALTAMAYLQMGQIQDAHDAAQHAHTLGDGVLSHLARSYALQGLGRLTDARDVMHGFNSRTPQSAIALAREAELALTLDQANVARMRVDQALAVEPGQPYAVSVSGLVYLIDGNAGEAKSAFEIALKRDPKDARALLGLGLAEIRLGNFQVGQAKLQEANEADPGNALILTYLGRSQQQLGQTQAARASWHSAQQADPKDPTPWLYQAQLELQTNHPVDAQESLRQAQARTEYRSVYRGEQLLKEDKQLLLANVAEAQRQLGLETLAFQSLSDSINENDAANLRNQAELLQGQRFGESARRSLLLQSQFNDKVGNLPAELDIYGDGVGQIGAKTPQHGAVSELGAKQASYNNYDELFSQRATLAVDAIKGNQATWGEQIRLGAGGDTFGIAFAQRHFLTDGGGAYQNLDNRIWQGMLQWQPAKSTGLFVSYQNFNSRHGEIAFPADPFNNGALHRIEDSSSITRLGGRHSLDDSSELRGLISRQQTDQTDNYDFMASVPPYSDMGCYYCGPYPTSTNYSSSNARSAELQYSHSGTSHAAQWGVSAVRSPRTGTPSLTNVAQQIYMDWRQALNPYWLVEAGLAWGKNDKQNDLSSTSLRRWLPRLGMVYTPDNGTHVRAAAWKSLNDAAVGNASLAPATLAGVVVNRPDDTYKLVRGIALGADKQLDAAWLLEGRVQRRWTEEPYSPSVGAQAMTPVHIDESRVALHWQLGNQPLNVTLAYDDEYIWSDPTNNWPNSVLEQHLRSQQLGLRWLASSQWTANLAWSHNLLAATQQSNDANPSFPNPILLDVRDRFNQADASLNWQFIRRGAVDIGVRNAANRGSQYTETDPLIPRFSKGRLVYMRLKLAW